MLLAFVIWLVAVVVAGVVCFMCGVGYGENRLIAHSRREIRTRLARNRGHDPTGQRVRFGGAE